MTVATLPITLAETQAIEEAALNAWPALQQTVLDGWLLRFAGGYTGRANSVNALYAGHLDVDEKIERCQRAYQARGLPANFRITPIVQPGDLDAFLDARGYALRSPTSVQWLDLASWIPTPDSRCDGELLAWDQAAAPWLESCVELNQVPAQAIPTLRGILDNIPSARRFLLLFLHGRPVACGLGVVEGRYAGLFKIATHPAFRGRGLATRLVAALLAWAKDLGSGQAYLQVTVENEPAHRLYARFGFAEVYRYWYRTR